MTSNEKILNYNVVDLVESKFRIKFISEFIKIMIFLKQTNTRQL
jgi:hypothetical protein